MIRFRRWVQGLCLSLFLLLLVLASLSKISMGSLDLFLQMDPSLILISAISARILLLSFIPGVLVLISGPFIGRVFCGYICPMGITLDTINSMLGHRRNPYFLKKSLLKLKYLILAFLLGSALFGVSFIFFASPLSLITRFYGLVLFPVISFLSREALDIIRPVADMLDITFISFAQIRTIRFATQFFILFFFSLIFAMTYFSTRFWCRYLCPSGTLLALCSRAPLIRRKVSEKACTQCGRCVKKCPMAAIDKDMSEKTIHSECIVCRTCEEICPEKAVHFGTQKIKKPALAVFSPERRQMFSTGLIGSIAAVMSLADIHFLYGKAKEGQMGASDLIRPPGAVLEIDFLSRCVRCGECMAACPTNTLQPIWFKAGFPGLFSPGITPRQGFCNPLCHDCGKVCPTNAIRPIKKADRIWAKTGTANIIRQKCLAWEYNKPCMVCDEVCPYDAIEFQNDKKRTIPVPHVLENKCAGCGYCEHFCPIQYQPAIVVTCMNALRINSGDYETLAKQKGFNLRLNPSGTTNFPVQPYSDTDMQQGQGFAPGFD